MGGNKLTDACRQSINLHGRNGNGRAVPGCPSAEGFCLEPKTAAGSLQDSKIILLKTFICILKIDISMKVSVTKPVRPKQGIQNTSRVVQREAVSAVC